MAGIPTEEDYVLLDDAALLRQCDVQIYKSSGPGGQHRNKVSSAVRLRHCPTGLSAHGDESRSQHDNKRLALRRLRMKIACHCRRPVEPGAALPSVVAQCIHQPRGRDHSRRKRLHVGRRDHRFWPVAAFVLDVLECCGGRLADSADLLGISTGGLAAFLRSERHLLAAVQAIRENHGHKPLA
jgi:hypothetical protein